MLKKLMVFFVVLILVLLYGMNYPADVVAEPISEPVLSIDSLTGQAGDVIRVPVSLISTGQIGGMEFSLSYDPSLLEYQSTLAGELSSGFSVFANPVSESSINQIKVIVVNFSGRKIPAGSGVAAYLDFEVNQEATGNENSPLDLNNVVMADAMGERITSVNLINGKFQVAAESGGGSGGSADNTIESDLVQTPLPEKQHYRFSDLLESHWAAGNILELCQAGVISGYPDGSFRPADNVTRAEFIKMMVLALDLKIESPVQPSFGDVLQDRWYYGYVEAAVKAGLVNGAGNKFLPEAKISRQEIAIILVRALGRDGEAVSLKARIATEFADDQLIAIWSRGYVVAAVQDGLISGYPEDNSFRSERYANRAESCAMISRFRIKLAFN